MLIKGSLMWLTCTFYNIVPDVKAKDNPVVKPLFKDNDIGLNCCLKELFLS